MNRRLMMAQQSKGFELIYNSSNGVLPTEKGWNFDFWMYGNNTGGTQVLSGDLLRVNVQHAYEACRYYIPDRAFAENCEISVTVDSFEDKAENNTVAFLLTNGIKAIEVVFRPYDSGRLSVTNRANNLYNGRFHGTFGVKDAFTLTARLENGALTVLLDDIPITQVNELYDVSEISTMEKALASGMANYNCVGYAFRDLRNAVAFARDGIYNVSNLTYKEW